MLCLNFSLFYKLSLNVTVFHLDVQVLHHQVVLPVEPAAAAVSAGAHQKTSGGGENSQWAVGD